MLIFLPEPWTSESQALFFMTMVLTRLSTGSTAHY